MNHRRFLLGVLACIMAVSVFAQADSTPIGPRDVLSIKVLEDPTVSTDRITVGPDGRITLNLLGKVDLTGLTPLQAEARIKSLLEAKFMNKATVAIQVLEYSSKPISIVGAVTRPGNIVGSSESITLIQAITQAGGLAAGYGKELYVLRTAPTGLTEQIAIDIDDLLVKGNPDLNLPLMPNDVINVPVEQPITVYILGEVMRPGKSQFRRSQAATLLQALADVGGPTDRASKIVVLKRRVNGKEQTTDINYVDIIRGKRADIELQDNDTIYVRESFF